MQRNSAASSRTEVNRSTFESQEKEMDMLSNLFSPSNARSTKFYWMMFFLFLVTSNLLQFLWFQGNEK